MELNEIESFRKRIKKTYKQFTKNGKEGREKAIAQLIEKSAEERLTYKFYNYTKRLRAFIETGKI
jgi:hypothetical protein